MIVYTVTKIFGIDAVKTRVFKKKFDAEDDIQQSIRLFVDSIEDVDVIPKENEEVYYIVNNSEKAEDYIAFILRRAEVK